MRDVLRFVLVCALLSAAAPVHAQIVVDLARQRPGQTPLRLDLLRDGAAGTLDLSGAQSVRVDADLVGTLRAQPGVRTVKLSLSKPWAN